MFGTLLMLLLVGGVVGGATANQPAASPDAEILKKAGLKTDGASLLAFFRKRSLPEDERATVAKLVRQLGSVIYSDRDDAAAELIQRGPAVGELVRAALVDHDLEIVRRAERCLAVIRENDVAGGVPAAAMRELALRKPAGAVSAAIAFLPFADNDQLADEARVLLARLAKSADGKADPLLVAALTDRSPVRRAAAGQALARAGLAAHRADVRKLLGDPDAEVRFRVAQALAYAGDTSAVTVLVDSLPDLSLSLAWQAEDFLLHLAGPITPPAVSMGNDPATRRQCRDGWLTWWKDHAAQVDLAKLEAPTKLKGYTLIVLLDESRVIELGPNNQQRWSIDNLSFPLDAQLIGENRVLVAEYYGNRVTERDLKGTIVWQKDVIGPQVAQRLPNGHTFVVTDKILFEFDKDGKQTLRIDMTGDNKRVLKAMKLPNGEIACLTNDARVSRLDTTGKELHGFDVSLGTRLFGGRLHMLSNGRVLVPHNAENKVVEYDGQGKVVWEVEVRSPVVATRLPNGNTLVTSMDAGIGAVEFDRAGNQVWQYTSEKPNSRVTRAIRR
jgi:hypothetical protein